jgi:hypothetical protein
MIFLSATRVDNRGHFRYVIEAVARRSIDTDDLSDVVVALKGLGVGDPYPYIAHAEQWGAVELSENGLNRSRTASV